MAGSGSARRKTFRSRSLPGCDSSTSGFWDTEFRPICPREGAGRSPGGAGGHGWGGCCEFPQYPGRGGCPREEAGKEQQDWPLPGGQERGSASTVVIVTGICRGHQFPLWVAREPGSWLCISPVASGQLLNLLEPQFPLFKKGIMIPQTS